MPTISDILFTAFLASLFIPYIVCKYKGIDVGHPGSIVGELNIDIQLEVYKNGQ